MKKYIRIIILILIFSSCKTKEVKTKIKYDKEIIVGIERYNRNGKLELKKECQFIENWGEYLTFITGFTYNKDLKENEYYVHSNIEVRKINFSYSNDSLKSKFCKKLDSQDYQKGKRNVFGEVFSIDSLHQLIEFVETKTDTITKYECKRIVKSKETELYVTEKKKKKTEKIDSLGHKIVTLFDSWRNQNDYQLIKKYSDNLLIQIEKKTPYNHSKELFKYNSKRELIEEIDFWDFKRKKFQKKIHSYKKGNKIKTLFYHGNDLAFIYKYKYDRNNRMTEEIIERITEEKSFANRRKIEKYHFKYEYF